MRGVLIRLTNVALFTLACWLVSLVFNEILAERLRPHGISAQAGAAYVPESAPQWDERKVIIDRNLFGAKVAHEPSPVPVVEVSEEVEETKLPLELLGTLWSSDSQLSTAAIRDTSSRVDQVLAVGETLEERDQVTVAAIERGRVILQNGSRREELLLAEAGETVGGRPLPGEATNSVSQKVSRARSSRSSRAPSYPVAKAGSSSPSRSPVARTERSTRSSRGADRELSPSQASRGRRQARTEKQRTARLNHRLSTQEMGTSKASKEEQLEVQRVLKSLIESGADPDEISARMNEMERE
ncbi:MAG: hypothetical protein JRG96_04260 [Deltaproteobacteria bacterium]|nr:hypothetical protein [Deltaproteobacteria bacterium]MBW2419673.1 hypothetical protein [Deltaproteobacteria bacterium]